MYRTRENPSGFDTRPERCIRRELDAIAEMLRDGAIEAGTERLRAACDRYRRASGDAWPTFARVVIARHPIAALVEQSCGALSFRDGQGHVRASRSNSGTPAS